jgi:hypothetical protein
MKKFRSDKDTRTDEPVSSKYHAEYNPKLVKLKYIACGKLGSLISNYYL